MSSTNSSADKSSAGSTSASNTEASSRVQTEKSQMGGQSQMSARNDKTQIDASQAQSINAGRVGEIEPKKTASAGAAKSGGLERAKPTGRKVTILRHGERMDRVFPTYMTDCYDPNDKYYPADCNHPLRLAERKSGKVGHINDPCCTEIGKASCMLMGQKMKITSKQITHLYASPSLRCVESAAAILKGFGDLPKKSKIRVEPGLFEWMQWYKDSEPEWLDNDELLKMGFPLEEGYTPICSANDVLSNKSESLADCYKRMAEVVQTIVEKHSEPGSNDNILIIGHGLTVDGANRTLRNLSLSPPNPKQLIRLGLAYPYLSGVAVEEMSNDTWKAVDNHMLPFSMINFNNRICPKTYNR